jgi:archaellum biogenesis ATPase FlaH
VTGMRESTWEILSFAIPALIGLVIIILAACL